MKFNKLHLRIALVASVAVLTVALGISVGFGIYFLWRGASPTDIALGTDDAIGAAEMGEASVIEGDLFLRRGESPTDIALGTDDAHDTTEMGEAGIIEGDLPLQIPLDRTVEQRNQLMAELRRRAGYDLRDIYEKYLDVVGANGLIASIQSVDPKCHTRGHDLGKVIYAKLRDVGTALRTVQDVCYSGGMHGVLMEHFTIGEHVALEAVKKQITTICENPAMSATYKIGDCVHGTGHAIMFLTGYDIPTALGYCGLWESGPTVYYCATGAYMEYVETHDKQDRETKPSFYPCDQYNYPAACFRYKLVKVVQRHYRQGQPLGDLINACAALKGKYRLGCFHGLGNAHMGDITYDRVNFKAVCGDGTEDDQYMCIEGAIERMGKYHPIAAKEQCDDLSGWQRDLCLKGAIRGMYNLDKPFDLYLLDNQ